MRFVLAHNQDLNPSRVSLNDTGLGKQAMSVLTSIITSPTFINLSRLELMKNNIGDLPGSKLIADALPMLTGLVHLDLRSNNISNIGFINIFTGVG